MLLGSLVTYRRPKELAACLDVLTAQTRQLDHLVVVDNDRDGVGSRVVDEHIRRAGVNIGRRAAKQIHVLPQAENLGAAGGWATGQRLLLQFADENDWIVLLDDDDPLRRPTQLQEHLELAEQMLARDPRTAAIGGVGAFFDADRGRFRRLTGDIPAGIVKVDYVGSGHGAVYRASVMREIGPFYDGLFLGYTELEYSLRLRQARYNVYVVHHGPSDPTTPAEAKLGWSRSRMHTEMPAWRVYYTTRNLTWMLRHAGHRRGAIRAALRRGLGRPLSRLTHDPRSFPMYSKAGLLGIYHGLTDRMGPLVNPADRRLRVASSAVDRRHSLAWSESTREEKRDS